MKKLLTRKEYEQFLKDIPEGVCSFCAYKEYQVVLKDGYQWYWCENIAPYFWYHSLIVPKRHIKDFFDITSDEWVELKNLVNYATDIYRSLKLKRSDGKDVEKFIYSWRRRDNLFDPISGNTRPDHWHLQICPDKDHLFDPIIEPDAYKHTISNLLKNKKGIL